MNLFSIYWKKCDFLPDGLFIANLKHGEIFNIQEILNKSSGVCNYVTFTKCEDIDYFYPPTQIF